VITNVERVTELNFTFPAITICQNFYIEKNHIKNGKLINKEIVTNLSMKNFIGYSYFKERSNAITDRLEFFRLPQYQVICTRFNGASNQNLEKQLVKVNKTNESFFVGFNHKYTQNITENEYFLYQLGHISFGVFIEDNYLNSFYGKFSLMNHGIHHVISIVKSETEEKLVEPYSECKKSINDQPYRRQNCIESCIYTKIGTNFNCTLDSLFRIDGLKECKFNVSNEAFFNKNKGELLKGCTEECPH